MKHNGKEWRPIPDFGGYYASSDGEILTTKQKRLSVMVPMKQKDGHLYVYLYDGRGNQKKMFVHRLVLMAFVRMPNQNEEARHLNDIPNDNRLENLAWGSRTDNESDKRRNGGLPIGERSGSHKLTESQVLEVREKYRSGISSRDIAAEYGVTHTTILKIARGQRWKHVSSEPIIVKHSTIRKDYRNNQKQNQYVKD